jgi:hypothetical protein
VAEGRDQDERTGAHGQPREARAAEIRAAAAPPDVCPRETVKRKEKRKKKIKKVGPTFFEGE